METTLLYGLIIVSVALVATILMQQSDAGMGNLFGESDEMTINRTRRGAEKTLFNSAIFLTAIFAGLSLASFLIQ